jgi:hypothetical protein
MCIDYPDCSMETKTEITLQSFTRFASIKFLDHLSAVLQLFPRVPADGPREFTDSLQGRDRV